MRSEENQRLTDAINATLREDQEARERPVMRGIILAALGLSVVLAIIVFLAFR